jgi:hypothetical protein
MAASVGFIAYVMAQAKSFQHPPCLNFPDNQAALRNITAVRTYNSSKNGLASPCRAHSVLYWRCCTVANLLACLLTIISLIAATGLPNIKQM